MYSGPSNFQHIPPARLVPRAGLEMMSGRYFVLPEPISGVEPKNMFGRVVQNPANPGRKYAPYDFYSQTLKKYPHEFVPQIFCHPVEIQNFSQTISRLLKTSGKASVGPYFGFKNATDHTETFKLTSSKVRRYGPMQQTESHFNELMKHEKYADDITDLLRKSRSGKVFMVVAFYTTANTLYKIVGEQKTEFGGHIRVPLSEAGLGISGVSADPGLEGSRQRQSRRRMTARVKSEEIFAVAYDIVSFESSLPRYFVKTRPVLGDEKRVPGKYLGFGSDNESDEGVADYDPSEAEIAESAGGSMNRLVVEKFEQLDNWNVEEDEGLDEIYLFEDTSLQ